MNMKPQKEARVDRIVDGVWRPPRGTLLHLCINLAAASDPDGDSDGDLDRPSLRRSGGEQQRRSHQRQIVKLDGPDEEVVEPGRSSRVQMAVWHERVSRAIEDLETTAAMRRVSVRLHS